MADREGRIKKRMGKAAGEAIGSAVSGKTKKAKRKMKKHSRLSDKLKKISSNSKQKDAYSVSGYKLGSPTGSHMERLKSEGERLRRERLRRSINN
jgi:hypothetical protein